MKGGAYAMAETDTEKVSFARKFVQFMSNTIPTLIGVLIGAVLLPLFCSNDRRFVAMKTILITITVFVCGLVFPQIKKLSKKGEASSKAKK
jgi:hypothetical protein